MIRVNITSNGKILGQVTLPKGLTKKELRTYLREAKELYLRDWTKTALNFEGSEDFRAMMQRASTGYTLVQSGYTANSTELRERGLTQAARRPNVYIVDDVPTYTPTRTIADALYSIFGGIR